LLHSSHALPLLLGCEVHLLVKFLLGVRLQVIPGSFCVGSLFACFGGDWSFVLRGCGVRREDLIWQVVAHVAVEKVDHFFEALEQFFALWAARAVLATRSVHGDTKEYSRLALSSVVVFK
jgi:hypothetical protein